MVNRRTALALVAAAPVAAPRFAVAQTLVTLRVGAAFNDTYAEAHYGQEAGIFAKYGINLEISDLANAQAIVAAAAGGALDLGMADMIQLINPIQKGVPFAYFAGGCLYKSEAPQTLLIAAKTSPLAKPKDFEGQTIAVVALNSISSMSVTEWLREGGADLAKVKIFEMTFASMVPALQRGTVAAAFLAEPFVSGAKNDVKVVASTYDTIAKEFYIGAWFASRDWAARNAPLAKKVNQAIYETAAWCNTHRDETAVMLSKMSKIELDRVKGMARSVFATSLEPRLMQPVIDIAAKYHLIEKPVNAADLLMRV